MADNIDDIFEKMKAMDVAELLSYNSAIRYTNIMCNIVGVAGMLLCLYIDSTLIISAILVCLYFLSNVSSGLDKSKIYINELLQQRQR